MTQVLNEIITVFSFGGIIGTIIGFTNNPISRRLMSD